MPHAIMRQSSVSVSPADISRPRCCNPRLDESQCTWAGDAETSPTPWASSTRVGQAGGDLHTSHIYHPGR